MPQYVRDSEMLQERDIGVDPDTPLWRYLDLTKLLWTLSTRSLWFARADTLGDPYEGSSTRALRAGLEAAISQATNGERMMAQWSRSNRAFVKCAAISCWHMSEHESAAMWSLYVSAGQGIAIRSTVRRLIEAFPEGRSVGSGRDANGAQNVIGVEFGPIRYIDYEQDRRQLVGPLVVTDPFFLKRKSYEHEREFRALVFDFPIRDGVLDFERAVLPEGGVAVPVDLDSLLELICLPPKTPRWVKQVVEDALRRFDCRCNVRQSDLDRDPIF